jgi:hypothetical protein
VNALCGEETDSCDVILVRILSVMPITALSTGRKLPM